MEYRIMKGQETLFSHKSDDYITPKWLIDEVSQYYELVLDACTTEDNPLNLPKYYTEKEDGLKKPWKTWTWCNPPYSQAGLWVEKAFKEWKKGHRSILLLPARTDTKWFHKWIYDNGPQYRFLKGRLKFEGMDNSAPFPSMLVIFI
jgi:site-specific DNA-methyltransferase (adenine-specific)